MKLYLILFIPGKSFLMQEKHLVMVAYRSITDNHESFQLHWANQVVVISETGNKYALQIQS